MKILPCGVAVIEGDTHHTKWIDQEFKLDIAEKLIHKYKQWIPVGGVVVDAGAMYGDHTITYAKLVGPRGRVYAFEPHPESFRCLSYNMQWYSQVTAYEWGLSDKTDQMSLVCGPNIGASWMSASGHNSVRTETIDTFNLRRLDFLKLDIEGFEVRALIGAEDTIKRCRPAILCEVNTGALERAGTAKKELFDLLALFGYQWEMVDPNLKYDDPQYDIFCTPAQEK